MKVAVLQHDKTDCGAACLASIARYYRLKFPISKIREMAGTGRVGTSAFGLIKAANALGFEAKGVRVEFSALRNVPLPAIAHIKRNTNGNHFVVVLKVGKRFVKVMDPALGKVIKLELAEFEKVWSNVLVLIIPGGSFEEGVKKTSNISRFLFLMAPHKWVFFQSTLGAFIYTILGLSVSIYVQKLTDFVLVGQNKNLLNLLGVVMLGVLLLQVCFGFLKSYLVLKTGQRIDARLLLGYFRHLMNLPQRFFDSMRIGEIISRVNDALKIRAFINDVAVGLTVDLSVVVFAFLMMLVYNWQLALLAYLVIPFYGLVYFLNNSFNRKIERKWMESSADLEVQLVESIRMVKTVKQFGIEEAVGQKAEGRFILLLRRIYDSSLTGIFSSNSIVFLNRLLTIILLWVGAYFVLDKRITPGELMSFFALTSFVSGPVARMVNLNKSIQKSLVAADRLFEIMDLEREKDEHKVDLAVRHIGDIKFQDIHFSYTLEQELFQGFNLDIEKGKITAILGDSGSGKSTLGVLLQRLYLPAKGQIFIGDFNIDYISNASLRRVIGVVPQELELFSGSVVENVALGEYRPRIDKVLEVLKRVGLKDYVDGLPEGIYSWLSENASNLSGGQRQRLAIARMLYRDPEIIIFDEATSYLDDRSEMRIKEVMVELRNCGKTIIQIAHRLTSIDMADRVLVIERGEVKEDGTIEGLYQRKGRFFEMVQNQFSAFLRFPEEGVV